LSSFVIVAVILGVQVVYWVLWLFAFSRDPKKVNTQPTVAPVSIIVCAHDEEENLKELLPLLLQQDHPQFEVIVVEDRSNDGTYDYLLDATQKDSRLRMVRVVETPSHIQGKKFAITLGVKAARFDWVLLTDADCRPATRAWARNLSSMMEADKHFVLGFSPYIRVKGLLNSFIRFETFVTAIQFMGMASLGKPYMGVGRNLAYRKSLFLDTKGFNNYLDVVGGDDDLFVNEHATRSNVSLALGESVLVHSKPEATWSRYFYQKLRHLSVGKHYKFSDRLILGIFTLSWILTWIAALPLAIFSPWAGWLMGLFVLRWICQSVAFEAASRKLGEPFESWKVPILDFIYAFYYLVAGPVALLSKKVRWKN
jgi:glycosyltransferase involved in cell wall biosynthesis